MKNMKLDEDLIYEILSAVGEIPYGRVATYGQIARLIGRLIGRDKNARLVGRVLSRPNTMATTHATEWSIIRAAPHTAGRSKERCCICAWQMVKANEKI